MERNKSVILKWVGDTMERLLASKYLSVRVSSVLELTPEIKKISFSGDFSETDFYPGDAVAFRVSDHEFRNYTLSAFNKGEGSCEIIFHTHGAGPGSHFATHLLGGEQLKMVIPRGRKMLEKEKKYHFFFGDETSLSLVSLFAREIRNNNQYYHGILELRMENLEVIKRLDLSVHGVLKSPGNPAKNAISCLEVMRNDCPDMFKEGLFYLTGNGLSIQRFRRALKMMGVIPKNIKAQAYWI
ncbi:siderophore-interacting protein [Pedobacter sp. PLR]|uniref:siderophore-interacting protein n=1 Tax=Pedobacter sp. PLR TaxID=2994465 RepID=UPI002245A2F2|nr:siderophore-interacting protein [Pedobacter sp. PLR]MCX2449755.1 siderophore-interacting protein [Pedobacter sp. PLR]